MAGMMKGQGGPSEHAQTEAMWAAVAFLAVMVVVFVWYAWRDPIVYTVYGLNYVEVEAVRLVRGLGPVGSKVEGFIEDFFGGYRDPHSARFDDMLAVMQLVGEQTRYAVVAVIVALAAWVFFRMRGEGQKRQYTLSQFMTYQTGYWKVALAGSDFDPEADGGSHGPALRPVEWMQREKILLRDGEVLNSEDCKDAFVRQLGPPYLGFANLPIYSKALAVLFTLSHNRDPRTQELKEALTEAWIRDRLTAERLTAALLEPIIADKKIEKIVDRHAGQHAFVNTAMIGLFEWAKGLSTGADGEKSPKGGGGVMACSEILWLKPVDRQLWYALQNTGRYAYFIEGAGSRAHFFAERVSREAKVEPFVDEALHGLRAYIKDQGLLDLALEAPPPEKE